MFVDTINTFLTAPIHIPLLAAGVAAHHYLESSFLSLSLPLSPLCLHCFSQSHYFLTLLTCLNPMSSPLFSSPLCLVTLG